jgi:LysR family transcriptional regulator, nitrogen assimilation regulatory protein
MNLRRLRLFLKTAAEGSVSRAAQAQGIAQPALTRQVQLLEAEIGTQLFDRSPRGLRLTEAGQFLKDALELPLSEIETALRSARSYSTHVKASLTIGMPPSISELFGKRLVTRLRDELPNIALRIVEDDSSKLAFDLSRRLIDTAVLVSVVPEQRVSRAQVLSEPLMLVGAADAPAVREGVLLRNLEELPLILPSASSGVRINLSRAAEAAAVKIAPVMEVDSIELTKRLVQQGDLYTILPTRAFSAEVERGVLAGVPILEPRLTQPVFWAVKPDWRLPRAIYNELERVVIEEWYDAVNSGEWAAEWVFDFAILSIPFTRHKGRAAVSDSTPIE